ncbi:MAG: thioredoxin [Acidimicrobiia bacterium]|nr:thioredoxin [Acidimicrobiia bacterium]
MPTIDITKETFNDTISDNDTVLVDFWADWCTPCKQFAPTYAATSEEHPDIVFAKVDTEDQVELAQAFDIRSIPTLMAVRENVVVYSQPGALPKDALDDLIGQLKALDMEEVHAQIAAEQDGSVADQDGSAASGA